MAGISLMSVLYMQVVRGLSPQHAGLWLVPQNIAMIVGSMAAPALARRIRPAYLMAGGLLVASIGMLAQTRTDAAGGVAAVVVGLTLAGLGISPAMALMMNLMLGAAPPDKAGSAASISETSGEFGIAVGIAALGSLATAVYRANLVLPEGLSAATENAARQGITAATGAAQQLPAALGADLLDSARTAFTAGMTTVAGIGAVIFVGLAVLVAVTFRHIPATAAAPAVQGHADDGAIPVPAAA
jgi:DHA2 family multidrug resistance protein-like MFS transporter